MHNKMPSRATEFQMANVCGYTIACEPHEIFLQPVTPKAIANARRQGYDYRHIMKDILPAEVLDTYSVTVPAPTGTGFQPQPKVYTALRRCAVEQPCKEDGRYYFLAVSEDEAADYWWKTYFSDLRALAHAQADETGDLSHALLGFDLKIIAKVPLLELSTTTTPDMHGSKRDLYVREHVVCMVKLLRGEAALEKEEEEKGVDPTE